MDCLTEAFEEEKCMDLKDAKNVVSADPVWKDWPSYEPPRIITYTSDEILEQIGPAMACSPSPCTVTPVI